MGDICTCGIILFGAKYFVFLALLVQLISSIIAEKNKIK